MIVMVVNLIFVVVVKEFRLWCAGLCLCILGFGGRASILANGIAAMDTSTSSTNFLMMVRIWYSWMSYSDFASTSDFAFIVAFMLAFITALASIMTVMVGVVGVVHFVEHVGEGSRDVVGVGLGKGESWRLNQNTISSD